MSDPQQTHARTTAKTAKTAKTAMDLEARLSREQWHALLALRDSYQQAHDLLSAREQTRLRFVRWLIDTGRVGS